MCLRLTSLRLTRLLAAKECAHCSMIATRVDANDAVAQLLPAATGLAGTAMGIRQFMRSSC